MEEKKLNGKQKKSTFFENYKSLKYVMSVCSYLGSRTSSLLLNYSDLHCGILFVYFMYIIKVNILQKHQIHPKKFNFCKQKGFLIKKLGIVCNFFLWGFL